MIGVSEQIWTLRQSDGHITRIYPYLCDGTPRASLVLLHGMAEYHSRYDAFAQALNAAGIDAYLYDHRGHGIDTKMEDLGWFASSAGHQRVIDDALAVSAFVREKKRTKDYFIFGHSMGSIITRCVLQQDDDFTGAVLSGSTRPAPLTTAFGLALTRLIQFFKGDRHHSPFMNHILFESRPYLKLSDRTVMDWLTRDHTVVGAYLHDPYCGFVCTISFYHDLIKLSSIAGHSSSMLHTRKDLPMLFASGDHDPVGGYGKQITSLVNFYEKHNYTDVTCKLYPDDRHELLNELDRDAVTADIIRWIEAWMT